MTEEERIYSEETATRRANLALMDRLIEHFNSNVVPSVGNVSAWEQNEWIINNIYKT